jgi:NAD-dependent deacetylase
MASQTGSGNLEYEAAGLIRSARYAIAYTGAGISTESNIPDFRGTNGLWKRFDPKMASRSYFLENPDGFWGFYAKRYEYVMNAVPNKAHNVLAEMERRGCLQAVITQNIDKLHSKAGSKSVIELHGNIVTSRCDACCKEFPTADLVEKYKKDGHAPSCERCGTVMRPCIVLFEEPVDLMENALRIARQSDLCLAVGSSLCVYPAATVPETVLNRKGKLIIVNADPTPMDGSADIVIRERASTALDAIMMNLENDGKTGNFSTFLRV